ncbi:T-complex protein 11-like protein 2 [Gouania willdenowi]|uniref:T-complex 11, testis-specific-like 2 n=1 Tax=Gouania willdenowi TaxID=441366 RepID=A0A8C5GZ07_GOUWI|nr:T-complex protein 11-like protein 2 [Gouania willdenowi]
MPLNDEQPPSPSSGEDQGSDVESSSEHCDSVTTSDLESSCESSKHCTPSSSPPKSLTLDEVKDTTRDMFNLSLSHEVIMNHSYRVQYDTLPQGSLWKLVRDNLHKAYWDKLESELNDDPPVYEHAIKLLEEIREILLSFLNPGANQTRTQITEVLDMDLIRQQAENDAVDMQGLASYIITTMGKMCTPMRDEEIKKLRENTDNIVILFREIFRVLDLMNLDMLNWSIRYLRHLMQRHGVEYEREKFQSILDKVPNALDRTTLWIRSALDELTSINANMEQSGKGQREMPTPFQVLNMAFLNILTWDYSKGPLPETWITDEGRVQEIQWQLQQSQAVCEVLLIIYSTVGGPIQGLPSLSERLKRMISVLLDGMHRPDFNLNEALEGISAQICCELNKSLIERGYPALSPALQATLKGQICGISQRDNPICTLVEDRVHHFFRAVLTDPKPQARLEQTPAGLTSIKPELVTLGSKFTTLVNYNRSVYGPFYANIMKTLMFNGSLPTPIPPQSPSQDCV